ncbi:MAG TPA: hypothetical protein DCG49_07300 [Ruminococcus sp.]|nr:hypothetical protein [Ruminococcus sp.]
MRIIKFILFFVCILAASCLTNEAAIQNHIFEIESQVYICHFDVHNPEQLNVIEQAAKQTGTNVFIVSENLTAAGQTEYAFYQTGERKKESAFPLPDTYKSLGSGTVTETVYPLSALTFIHENLRFCVERNENGTQLFFDTVTKEIKMTSREQIPLYRDHYNRIVLLVWGICWGLILFLAVYHVSSIRREISIRRVFGFSAGTPVLSNILADTVICIVLITLQGALLSMYSTFSAASNYLLYYPVSVLCAVLPYLSLLRFHVKDISQRNTGWKRLLCGSYILKFCAASMLLASLTLFTGVGLDAIAAYKTSCSAMDLRKYDLLQFEADPSSPKFTAYRNELDDAFADRQSRGDACNAFYTKHWSEVITIGHSTNGNLNRNSSFEVVYYNSNAEPLLYEQFAEELHSCQSEIIFLMPKPSGGITLKERAQIEDTMTGLLIKFGGGTGKTAHIETILYDKNAKVPYFEPHDNSLIQYADRPYIVISRSPVTDFSVLTGKLQMFDAAIAVPDEPHYLQKISEELPYVRAYTIDLQSSMDYLHTKSKRNLFSISLLIALMLLLQYVVTFSLVIFYHKINMKEIAILRTTGASFVTKYGKHLLATVLIHAITGTAGFFIINRMTAARNLTVLLFAGCLIPDVICLILIHLTQEKKNIVKVLKGGFL